LSPFIALSSRTTNSYCSSKTCFPAISCPAPVLNILPPHLLGDPGLVAVSELFGAAIISCGGHGPCPAPVLHILPPHLLGDSGLASVSDTIGAANMGCGGPGKVGTGRCCW
jgi:hypothetical protein